jgi:hypothetical protein
LLRFNRDFDGIGTHATGLGAYANNWFTRGLITWLTGANQGRKAEVKLHSK